MDEVAQRMEQEAQAFETMEIMLDSEIDRVSMRDLERMSAQLEKKAAGLEERMSKHEQAMRAMEEQMPEIDESAIRQIEDQAKRMENVLLEIAAEI